MQVFATINKGGLKINAGVNANNWLIKELVIKDLFGIQVIACVNVINHVILCVYLDYDNWKCRKKLMDRLVEECTETDEEVKLAKITLAEHENRHKNKFSFCTQYIVLFSIIITVNIGIGTYFIYHKYMNHVKKKLLLKKVLIIRQHLIIKYLKWLQMLKA